MTMIAPQAREAVPIAKRGRLSRSQREAVWMAHSGLCGLCRLPVSLRACEMDHILSLVAGGSNHITNWQPLHPKCHRAKTPKDRKIGAKIVRLIKRADGTRRPRKPIASPVSPWPKGKTRWPKRGFPKSSAKQKDHLRDEKRHD